MRFIQWAHTTIFSRLINRFTLQDVPIDRTEDLPLLNEILPITNIDELFKYYLIYPFTGIAVTATGAVNIYTVPPGKRWTVHAVYVGQQSGTFTFNALMVNDNTTGIAVMQQASGTTLNYLKNYNPFIADQGWQIQIWVDAKTGNGTVGGSLLVQEETAY